MSLAIAALAAGTLQLGCGRPNADIPYAEGVPDSVPTCEELRGLDVQVVAERLELPWAIDFAPDGRLFLTERVGRVRVIKDRVLQAEPWAEFAVAQGGVAGLTGIAVSPDFDATGYVYVVGTFSRVGESPSARLVRGALRKLSDLAGRDGRFAYENRVYRIRDGGTRGLEPEIIIDGLPADLWHGTSALRFGPDGMLYLSVGYAGDPSTAQDLGSLAGKILRYTPDGAVPIDNPWPGSPLYAIGFRHVQGLTWHPVTHDLFATDHGPTGLDEINRVTRGENYGWPLFAGPGESEGIVDPLVSWENTIAPSGLDFYADTGHSSDAELLIGALKGRHLRRVAIAPVRETGRWRASCEQALIGEAFGRIRAVRVAPDTSVYLTTSNRDLNGSPVQADDRLVRIVF